MKAPKVSVLMPVYNTQEDYLREAIESILNQTFNDFELIICDDGSKNNAIEVIHSYQDKRIRLIQNEQNLGLCATRNKLMQEATGEYVAWADSDDISVDTRFEKQVAFLDSNPDISMVGAWYERFPEYFVPQLPENVGLVDMLKWCAIAQPVAMYRKKDFETHQLTYSNQKEYNGCEDFELWVRLLKKGLKIANIQEVLLKYRWHLNNISHTRSSEIGKKVREIHKNIIQTLSGDLEVQDKLKNLFNPSQNNKTKNICFCGIRLLKIKHKGNKTKGYLFGFLPIFKVKGKK